MATTPQFFSLAHCNNVTSAGAARQVDLFTHKDRDRSKGNQTRNQAFRNHSNISLDINFLIMAAKLLRSIAPVADVEILDQHFKGKPEVSGTARKIAESRCVDGESITSLRLGGIIGHHEVIFSFPHQTVLLVHNSIDSKACGTGAAFALSQLALCGKGFYAFDNLLMKIVRGQLATG